MQKITEAAIGKNQQIVVLMEPTFRLLYITMYFADIKFPNKVSMTNQCFRCLDLKSKCLNRHHDCHTVCIGITDEIHNDDQTLYLMFYHVLQLSNLVRLRRFFNMFFNQIFNMPAKICTTKRPYFCPTLNTS